MDEYRVCYEVNLDIMHPDEGDKRILDKNPIWHGDHIPTTEELRAIEGEILDHEDWLWDELVENNENQEIEFRREIRDGLIIEQKRHIGWQTISVVYLTD